ncbi:LPXTG cell wall anchor domain-containing protein [Bacillus testis]|uniref:LPXTG cell wall anchor domain-containing protein n=1 Tax=Bacillus testis TaxID=1622072 RepID=UPI00067EE918|nr:LPXTG cell wall anchor domain-containing protein [Bacillus testis]
MKQVKVIRNLFYSGFLFSIFYLLVPYNIALASNKAITIDTGSPDRVLINVRNAVPGDTITRNIIISNESNENFEYITEQKNGSSTEKLYSTLIFTIKQKDTVLYKGLLKDFIALPSRFLAGKTSEKLSFKVEIPRELGNEYQNSKASMDFLFTAKFTENDGDSNSGDEVSNGTKPGDEGSHGSKPGDEGSGTNPGDGGNGGSKPVDEGNSGNNLGGGGNSGTNPEDGGNTLPATGTDVNIAPQLTSTQMVQQTNGTLPDTSTNMYNLLIGGFVLIAVGGIILVIQQRKSINRNR